MKPHTTNRCLKPPTAVIMVIFQSPTLGRVAGLPWLRWARGRWLQFDKPQEWEQGDSTCGSEWVLVWGLTPGSQLYKLYIYTYSIYMHVYINIHTYIYNIYIYTSYVFFLQDFPSPIMNKSGSPENGWEFQPTPEGCLSKRTKESCLSFPDSPTSHTHQFLLRG